MFLYTGLTIFLITCVKGSYGLANITAFPFNLTEAIDGNTTFTCEISGQQTMEQSVYWYKLPAQFETVPALLLSYNALSRDDQKYLIKGRYHLTILDIGLEDEGIYQCSLGDEAYLAALLVVAPPSVLSIELANNVSQVQSGQRVTLICHAKESRPPSERLRWFKGNNEITEESSMDCHTPDENGFGSCKSTVEILITSYDFQNSILCVVDLPDYPTIAIQEFQLPSGTRKSTLASAYVLVYSTIMAMSATYTSY